MKLILLMYSDSLFCIWILVIPIGITEISTHEYEVFYFISVPYTNSDIQVPETL